MWTWHLLPLDPLVLALFTVFADIFRRHDLSGVGKTAWISSRSCSVPRRLRLPDHAERRDDGANLQRPGRADQFDDYVRQTAARRRSGGDRQAKQLLDSGAITQAEFEAMKQKALRSRWRQPGTVLTGLEPPRVLGALRDADADRAPVAPRGAGDRARPRVGDGARLRAPAGRGRNLVIRVPATPGPRVGAHRSSSRATWTWCASATRRARTTRPRDGSRSSATATG